ncbi:DUF6792 domain-containing protein [Terribacillus sp. DMT04]|uniref:DUF6792 domain-containing protein n=1 Tax=Terribacillus sp. DMT04 TaxID=2850441 RepID=UPI001C2CA100|nr:DUF6792 domain-containing protein [Terribacillus sp. DMT04]QXE03338.1 hypothetical protein KS242_04105 [Terribacillus sp. DMT04]
MEFLESPEIKARLIDIEYEDLEPQELENRLKQLYLEETGELFEGEIDILHSSETKNETITSSNYDGTAIHISNDGHEEMYVISQGTQGGEDWLYNLKSMLAGQTALQAEATNEFVMEAKQHLEVDEDTKTYGLSHSLGHNNNTVSYLAFGTFDEVFSINGAQPNYYELFKVDIPFYEAVRKEFAIREDMDVYDIEPQKLNDFAIQYYQDKSDNIHQIISKDDPLYAASAVRGFFTLGNVTMVDTNPDTPGLRELMEYIPDDVVKNFQDLAIDFAVGSERDGTYGGVEALIGVDLKEFEGIDGFWSGVGFYFTHSSEIDTMIRSLEEKVPTLLDKLTPITENAEQIFSSLYEAEYITKEQKDVMVEEIAIIEQELQKINEAIGRNVDIRDLGNPNAGFGGDIGAGLKIYLDHVKAIMESVDRIKESGILDNLSAITDSHSISELLSVMSDGKKGYLGTDMVYNATKGDGEPIKVNISAALRMYQHSIPILEAKAAKISELEQAIHDELDTSYKDEERKVRDEIDQMEGSPGTYKFLLSKHGYYPTFMKEMKKISVHEIFPPLENNDFEEQLAELTKTVETGYAYIENYRKSIQDLFEEEEELSQLFDLSRRI